MSSQTVSSARPGVIPALQSWVRSGYMWVWVAVVALYLATLLLVPGAVSASSLASFLPFLGMLALVTLGQTVVVMQRGIDFSLPGAIVLSGIVMAWLTGSGWAVLPALAVTLFVGMAIGILNGIIVVQLSITPLVATLASNGIYIGIALMISGGFPVAASAELSAFSRGSFLAIPTAFWLALAFAAILLFAVNKTVIGRRFIAVGAAPLSARSAGIRSNRYVMLAYSVAGICYAMTGALISGYIGSARMTMDGGYLLASIAAVVIGGTPLTGGRGSLVASIGGAAFMALLAQLVLALGAANSVQLLVQALVLLAAVSLPSVIGRVAKRQKEPPSGQPDR